MCLHGAHQTNNARTHNVLTSVLIFKRERGSVLNSVLEIALDPRSLKIVFRSV